MKEALKELVS